MAQSTREGRRSRRPQRELSEQAEDKAGDVQDKAGEAGGGGAFSELKGVMSEAAVSVLAPVAKKAVTQAAKMAVERGPELLEDTVLPKLQDVGGKVGERFGGGGDDDEKGGNAGDGTGKGRRMPIQQSVDVGAPLDVVYDQFTQFEDYPKFMHRVERVEQRDEAHVVFSEKMWGVRRQWEAEIVEQIPDERIVWKTTSGMNHVGVVTFHELSERLTRVQLNLDLDPEGLVEKIARGGRFVKRAARADLKRFKAFVEMHDEETGEWRGEIQDGEVVGYDEGDEEREDERDEQEEEYEEPEASEEEEYEDDEPQEEEEDDEEPSRRATAKSKGNGGRAKSKSSSSSGSRSRSAPASKSKAKSQPKSKASNGRRSSRAKASSGKR